MGHVDGSGGIKAKFPVMPLPSEVTKPASYKDNNLSLKPMQHCSKKKKKNTGKKINDNSVLLAGDVNLRTKTPFRWSSPAVRRGLRNNINLHNGRSCK